ncbi:unnamed protein product [Rangifer tarandus platyrhynchus]|uniref:Uncharacterized protein n=1 Tax=Rangifer tarandus platyrhynchus TaxID=3082113 RepID=A0AC59ZAU3_RANTA
MRVVSRGGHIRTMRERGHAAPVTPVDGLPGGWAPPQGSGKMSSRGTLCPLDDFDLEVYSRGNGGPEAKGQPTVPAPPRWAGLPSRPGVTRPTRGSRSAVTVLKFLIAFGARHPLVAIAAQPVPSLGTLSCCVLCAGGLLGFACQEVHE